MSKCEEVMTSHAIKVHKDKWLRVTQMFPEFLESLFACKGHPWITFLIFLKTNFLIYEIKTKF